MHAYLLIKTFHLLFVIAWMAAVFYLPRILVNLAEAGDDAAVRARLLLMGHRLYRFGHTMFGFALVFGLVLWFGHLAWPSMPDMVTGTHWLHAKLLIVAALLAYYIVAGRLLKSVAADRALPPPKALRWFNELPVVLLLLVLYLVIAKPL